MSSAWFLLGLAGLLIAGNAVFVAAETALVTVDRNLVESRAREGSVRFGRVQGTLRRLSTYLSGAQLGITVTSLAIGFVAEPSVATLLRGPLDALGHDADVVEVTAVAIALLSATGVQMVFGELVPKNISLSRPVGTASPTDPFWEGSHLPGGEPVPVAEPPEDRGGGRPYVANILWILPF